MRDQKLTSAGSLELQRCHCASAWPFQREWLFGAGGPRAASAAFVLPYETNLAVTSRSPGIHCCCEISSTRDGTTTINHHPSCCDPASDLSGVCHNHKISNFPNYGHLLPCSSTVARAYRVSPPCQHCDSYPVALECTDDSALWSFPTLLFTEVAKWPHVFSVSLSSPGA